jgi:serine/threonine protein kinase
MGQADRDKLVGRTIAGKFVVEDLLGSGAMGAVFRARQISLDKTVAIKVLHGEHAGDPQFAARFQREAKAASRLNHPNSMQVLDYGAEPDGLLYIAMEYLDGRSLHALVRDEWPLAATRIADILMQTLAALAVAHDMGVVHRDLKPDNVMVLPGKDDDGRPRDIVKVCDFGIAKISDPRAYRAAGQMDSEAPLTTAGFLVGTPEYMSPEQGRGERLDPRSDLYSVGVILFEMLTKRVPFDAQSAIGIVLKHLTEEPPSPSTLVSGVDPRLEAIAVRALRKFREERYPNAREMRAELRAVAEGPAAATLPASPPTPVEPPVEQEVATRATVPAPSDRPSVTAATVAMAAVAIAADATTGGGKPTLVGTTAVVAGLPSRRRGLLLMGVTLAALVAGAGATAWMVRGPATSTAAASMTAPAVPPPPVMVDPGPSPTHAAMALTAPEASPRSRPGAPALTGSLAPAPSAPAKMSALAASAPPVASSAKHALPASAASEHPESSKTPPSTASAASPVLTAPAPTASVDTTQPAASVVVSASPVSPDPAPESNADPTFDPNRGYVEVGIINSEGVPERAVRGALHGLALSQCYKVALRTRGARSTGVATLNLSLDEAGLARSAIVTGADFLPGLTRCLQETAAGLRVTPSQMEPGGGTAEVTLSFKEP